MDGKKSHLGSFDREEDAARRYDVAARAAGKPLNWPDDGQPGAVKGKRKRPTKAEEAARRAQAAVAPVAAAVAAPGAIAGGAPPGGGPTDVAPPLPPPLPPPPGLPPGLVLGLPPSLLSTPPALYTPTGSLPSASLSSSSSSSAAHSTAEAGSLVALPPPPGDATSPHFAGPPFLPDVPGQSAPPADIFVAATFI